MADAAHLFHVALAEDWTAAQAAGRYTTSTRGRTLAAEGFIHCSFAGQLAVTAARWYGDIDEVVVLRIDPDRLTSPVVVEAVTGSGEAYPHVYGPIDLDAVVDARPASPLALPGDLDRAT